MVLSAEKLILVLKYLQPDLKGENSLGFFILFCVELGE